MVLLLCPCCYVHVAMFLHLQLQRPFCFNPFTFLFSLSLPISPPLSPSVSTSLPLPPSLSLPLFLPPTFSLHPSFFLSNSPTHSLLFSLSSFSLSPVRIKHLSRQSPSPLALNAVWMIRVAGICQIVCHRLTDLSRLRVSQPLH